MVRGSERRLARLVVVPAVVLLGALATSAPALGLTHDFPGSPDTGTLAISLTGTDAATVGCDSVNVTVNGTPLASPTVPCADVQILTVTGSTGFTSTACANTIDLSGVTAAAFPANATRTVNAGDGADTITGSPQNDTLNGGLHNDVLDGVPESTPSTAA